MPQTISTFKRKMNSQTVMAFVLLIFGMVVVMLSLYMPPKGEIHPSVITVFGMLLVASGTFMGIDLNFQLKQFVELARDKDKPSTKKVSSDDETD